jgi:Zn-dependent oligopeptidase
MRRILFPTLGVVLLLLAYAGQNLATGAPSAPRTTAQTAFPVARIANEAKVLKHIAVAIDRLVESRAPADPKERRLAKAIVRREAFVAEKADKIIADAHKAQTAQVSAEQEMEVEAQDFSVTGPTLTQEAKQELQGLQTEYPATSYAAMQNLILAQQDMFTTMSLSF